MENKHTKHNVTGKTVLLNYVFEMTSFLLTHLCLCTSVLLQVDDIVCLWQSLLDYDKQRIRFSARHQDRLTTGRFRSPKKKAVFTPGVDSLKRSVLASSASPAQWPDCCRLVEAIFTRLCQIHRSPRRKGKGSLSRWSLILEDYRKIRQLILSNGAIMQDTTLQLVEVNQTTLVQWHNGRVKKQDERTSASGD